MKTYIISEIGINHNGRLENCYKMIDASIEAGCSAVKFQCFSAKNLYPKSAGKLNWKNDDKDYSYDIYESVKKIELPLEWIDELMSYCCDKGIDFISSVFDIEGLNALVAKGMKAIKLPSYTITNIPLIEEAAKKFCPIILSSGGATLGETEEAVRIIQKYHNQLKLLHCSLQYPTPLHDCNLGVMVTLKYAFPEIEIGYSDHTREVSDAPVQSIYLGGSVIEKHITLDKKMEGPDHYFALEPSELKKMVDDIRIAEINYQNGNFTINKSIFGNSSKKCYKHEQYLREFAYTTLFAIRDIQKGESISHDDLIILRPGKLKRGMDPQYIRLFKMFDVKAKKNINSEESIDWDAIL